MKSEFFKQIANFAFAGIADTDSVEDTHAWHRKTVPSVRVVRYDAKQLIAQNIKKKGRKRFMTMDRFDYQQQI